MLVNVILHSLEWLYYIVHVTMMPLSPSSDLFVFIYFYFLSVGMGLPTWGGALRSK